MTDPKVFADFTNASPEGWVRLNLRGTIDDLEAQGLELKAGMRILLSDGELGAVGVVHFSDEEKMWVASIAWADLKEA